MLQYCNTSPTARWTGCESPHISAPEAAQWQQVRRRRVAAAKQEIVETCKGIEEGKTTNLLPFRHLLVCRGEAGTRAASPKLMNLRKTPSPSHSRPIQVANQLSVTFRENCRPTVGAAAARSVYVGGGCAGGAERRCDKRERERLSSGDGRRAKEDTKEDFERPTDVLACVRAVHGLWITPHYTAFSTKS